jgi:hypothetical protein
MNNSQKLFEAVTGFKASFIPKGPSQDYDQTDRNEIYAAVEGTYENADFAGIELDDEDVDLWSITEAIYDFHNTAECANDLDIIFNKLGDSK